MCVAVTLDPGAQLTLDELTKMDKANADGVGLAWVEDDGVHWWKTIKVNPQEVLENLQMTAVSPRLLHFRYATAGGTKDELCHPFDISKLSVCSPMGMGTKVMIHNGHWSRWNEVAKMLDDEDMLPDKGPWSDSRLAAFLAHVNEDWLQAMGGKVATLDTEGKIVRLGDWQSLREGIYVSNKAWEYVQTRRGGYSGHRQWQGWGDVTPPHGTNHGKTQQKGQGQGQPYQSNHYRSDWQKPNAALIYKEHPNAWYSEVRKEWTVWDPALSTMVRLVVDGDKITQQPID